MVLGEEAGGGGGIIAVIWLIALAVGIGKPIVLLYSQTQSLWLHLYVGYFGAGIILVKCKKEIDMRCSRLKQIGIALCINICSMLIYFYRVFCIESDCYPSFFYGRWFYTIWLISLFWLISMVKVRQNNVQNLIKKMSDNTFVVYLAHLPLLLYYTNRNPIQSVRMALLVIVAIFFVCEIIAELFRKLPMLRKLV